MGNPQCVVFCDEFHTDWEQTGAEIERHAHFPNRRQLLLAALNVLFERIRANHRDFTSENALERLREVGLRHTRLVSAGRDGFVSSYFEFIAAPPREGLREALAAGNGVIIEEVDPYQVAWLMTSRAWTEDVAQLMEVSDQWDQWTEGRSNEMLQMILDLIAAPGPA